MIARTRILLFAAVLAAAACGGAFPAPAQIVALGASNIAGRGVSSSEAFPAQLERMLAAKGYNVHVTNAGVNGDTNAGMLARLDQAVPEGTKIVLLGTRGGSFNARRLGQGDQNVEGIESRARTGHLAPASARLPNGHHAELARYGEITEPLVRTRPKVPTMTLRIAYDSRHCRKQ
jgi:acyl-CoA thioesterase-1